LLYCDDAISFDIDRLIAQQTPTLDVDDGHAGDCDISVWSWSRARRGRTRAYCGNAKRKKYVFREIGHWMGREG
jgi:hypothetical protein